MGIREEPQKVWVRWPDGKISLTDMLKKSGEITINYRHAVYGTPEGK